MPRISMIVSASTSSATLRVFENGALKTGMPRSCAAFRSTWLVPMQKQPTPTSFGALSKTSVGQLRCRTDADEVGVAHRLDQLLFRQRFLVVFDFAVAIVAKRLHGARIDAFQQKNLDLVFVERS